jgi:thiosulfate dehydrogenase (quinone) large subunit
VVSASLANQKVDQYNGSQRFFLLLMRVAIGWHFLYEGFVKIASSGWSAAGYLHGASGPFAGMFEYMVEHTWMVKSIDVIMIYGLSAIGLCLILGFFTRTAALGAAFLLLLFYISNPPFIGVQFAPGEGSYLIVNKNLVEFTAAMVLVVFPTGLFWGLDRLFVKE